MARRAESPRTLTQAERQARARQRRAAEAERHRAALARIMSEATSIRDARQIAAEALENHRPKATAP